MKIFCSPSVIDLEEIKIEEIKIDASFNVLNLKQ